MIIKKSNQELELMRVAGRIVAETHQKVAEAITPGITTVELDKIAEDYIKRQNAHPSFKGYHGFPASICASINHEVVHGIPAIKKLQEGDIISIDIGANYKGYHGDAAKTYKVGAVDGQLEELIDVTEQSLFKGIEQAVPGNRLSDISHAVEKHVNNHNFYVVKKYVGHGIGSAMHEAPEIPNFGPPGKGPRLKAGMVFAIEPMVNIGTSEVKTLDDHWTVITADESASAHFEHTVAITDSEPEILTKLT
ncbi:type I methionyl aminopeptidase [Natranaerobius thermophilus]|uniref:Methionine aminopeptidase n=1 Tax=Natranaerobius thermophilus (strain ATCC BAA-1301 / DSM 18059 / JW/NM-WN-LF) TaxID=457570 RepID=B2A4G3_NATTJ|nr:type I methionyl aminopeptidase [Natranaerobius thermophilus]ACB83815.1 methionine aminopeptidase, type I [Natranaerobius thermophilus JW/NM-WN-LF]